MGSFKCVHCGSDNGNENLVVLDQGDSSSGTLTVLVGLGDPGAVLLKKPMTIEARADLCRVCGAVQLRVDPDQLRRTEARLDERRHSGK
jgi:hypothetical protein